MAATTELTTLHRTVDELREVIAGLRQRYGDVPAVRRLLGDVDRIDLDASELDDLTPLPAASTAEASEILMLDDTPIDPALWAGADDEGVGGYHR
ncbi:MAG TPA: hypothetical protein VHC23_00210 [Jatrophihabitans sp.]|jgi:hypothetical protein|nr:hypothetical protein [Jatrophihabitans sp.]